MILDLVVMASAITMLLSLLISFYAMYAKLEEVERYLQFSTFIVTFKHMSQGGLFEGRMRRLFAIALVILMSALFQWRRLALVEDVKLIPLKLKLWMVIPFLLTLTAFAGMALTWCLIP